MEPAVDYPNAPDSSSGQEPIKSTAKSIVFCSHDSNRNSSDNNNNQNRNNSDELQE